MSKRRREERWGRKREEEEEGEDKGEDNDEGMEVERAVCYPIPQPAMSEYHPVGFPG